MDYSSPASSVHGIHQARILEWVAMPFSRGSSLPKDRTLSLTSPALVDWQAGSSPLAPPGKCVCVCVCVCVYVRVYAQLSQKTAPRRSGPSHILFHPFVQGWMQARCLFHACVVWIHIRDVKLPSPGWGTAELEGPYTGMSQVGCRLWGVESCKRTGREQGWVGSQVLQLIFLKVLDQMSSSVHRNDQWKVHNRNRKEFSLSQTVAFKGDSVPRALRNCSAEAWCPAQSSTSSKQRTYINRIGCIPSRFQKRQT